MQLVGFSRASWYQKCRKETLGMYNIGMHITVLVSISSEFSISTLAELESRKLSTLPQVQIPIISLV